MVDYGQFESYVMALVPYPNLLIAGSEIEVVSEIEAISVNHRE